MIPDNDHIDVESQAAGVMTVPVLDGEDPEALQPIPERGSRAIALLAGLTAGLVLGVCVLMFSTELRELVYHLHVASESRFSGGESLADLEMETRQIEIRVSRLRARLNSRFPRSPYLVVSTSDNRFELYGRGGLIREGVCSTGSYVLLQASDNQRWMFQTPRGAFRIQEKRVNPVWAKPDWAFVEEGLPVPAAGAPERFERGVLGDYALTIGNGYMIHGTLYQRMLGQPVTHGCIRLGDADLEAVFRELSRGARVFIY